MAAKDINEEFGLKDLTKENAVIAYQSDPNNTPVEFEDFPKQIDKSIEVPIHFREKKETWTRKNQKMAKSLKNAYKLLRKYKDYN